MNKLIDAKNEAKRRICKLFKFFNSNFTTAAVDPQSNVAESAYRYALFFIELL